MTMKLSEAMLKGCKMSKKAIGLRHDGGRTCALGAVELGAGCKNAEGKFPVLMDEFHHPLLGDDIPGASLNRIIADLNNGPESRYTCAQPKRPWSRERIARWLQSLGL